MKDKIWSVIEWICILLFYLLYLIYVCIWFIIVLPTILYSVFILNDKFINQLNEYKRIIKIN